MPDLLLIENLRKRYYYEKEIEHGNYPDEVLDSPNYVRKEHLRFLIDNFDNPIKISKSFKKLKSNGSYVAEYFEDKKDAYAAIISFQIKDFSEKCLTLKGKLLISYLKKYYDTIMPIIYKHQGEIESIQGDQIMVLFALPFLKDTPDGLLIRADNCAKEVIHNLKKTNKEVKANIDAGTIMYFRDKIFGKTPHYQVVGKPLSSVLKLEGYSVENAINFFFDSSYYSCDAISQSGIYRIGFARTHWERTEPVIIKLPEGENVKVISLKNVS